MQCFKECPEMAPGIDTFGNVNVALSFRKHANLENEDETYLFLYADITNAVLFKAALWSPFYFIFDLPNPLYAATKKNTTYNAYAPMSSVSSLC